jgi:hypothetical protein
VHSGSEINILLWFLVTYPKDTAKEQEYASRRAALTRDAAAPGLSTPAPTPDQAALLAEWDRMVFYVLAMQCVSTMAVVRRETNSWKWPLFQWFYMGALAWTFAFMVYQGGRLLGWR